MMTRSLLLLPVVLWSFVPRTSAAEPEPGPMPAHIGEAERDQARHLYDEAIQYGKRGEYRKAKASLSAAWALLKSWEIAVNLGSAEMRLGQYRDAAEHLAWGIRDGSMKEGEHYGPLVKAKTLLTEAAAHVGQLKLVADEPNASIFVDDDVVGKSPLVDPLYLDPGTHVVTARPANSERASLKLEVRIQAGDALERYLRFSTTHASVERASESADPAPVPAAAPRDSSLFEPRTAVPMTLGGLAAISSGVALAFTIKGSAANASATDWAMRTGGNCDSPTPACNGLADARERRNDANRIANVAWVGAGVFGVATLATVLFWPKTASPLTSAKLRIAPRTGDDMRGVMVMGTFE
jgi:tetratricopeptide (TPR) repeat protein